MSSLSRVLVEQITGIAVHPNADTLSLYELSNGYVVVHKTDAFNLMEKVVYVPVDMVAPAKPEYEFLDKYRVRGKKIRGIISCGLALPLENQDLPLDTDLTEEYGFVPYEAKAPSRPGSDLGKGEEVSPPIQVAKYDIEAIRKYHHVFNPEIVVTEKIHGAWFGALYDSTKNEFYVKSRSRWLKHDGNSVWSKVATKYRIEAACRSLPDMLLCGEVFGWVADLRYGAAQGELFLALFDIWRKDRFLNYDYFKGICDGNQLPTVPELYRGPWQSLDHIKSLGETTTRVGNDPKQIAEGVVVKPTHECWHPSIGRMILKYPSNLYLTRK